MKHSQTMIFAVLVCIEDKEICVLGEIKEKRAVGQFEIRRQSVCNDSAICAFLVNLTDARGDGRFDAAFSLVYWTPITRWRPNSSGESLSPNWAGRRAARKRRP
jgi:hypothetical protein